MAKPKGLKIVAPSWKWAHPLTRRGRSPDTAVWHHSASARTTTARDIDRWHKERDYAGVGYHFIVYPNGKVVRGRPWWAYGAHARGKNDAIGVVAIGNFEKHAMPKKQLLSLQLLKVWFDSRGIKHHLKHRQVNATACPGKRYPWEKVMAGPALTTGKVVKVPEPVVKPPWWPALWRWIRRVRAAKP